MTSTALARTLGRRAFAPLSLRLATSRRLCTIPEGASAFRRRILALEALHQQQEELEQAQHKRMAELEAEFFAESQQIYAQRQSIVSGAEEPDDALVASSQMGQVLDDSSFAQGTGDPESDAAFFARGGVPHFWAGAIRGCDPFHEATDDEGEMLPVVCDGDWEVLQHLVDVSMDAWEPPQRSLGHLDAGVDDDGDEFGELSETIEEAGYSLTFRFAPNDMLAPGCEELTLYCYSHHEVADVSPQKIEWQPGRDPTVRTTTRRPKRRKGKPPPEPVTVEIPTDSLFRIFTPPLSLDDDFGDASGGYGEAEAAAGVAHPATLQEAVVAMVRETLIPHATAYYLKSMAGSDGFEEEDDDGYGDRHLAHIFGPGILKDELEMPDGFEPEAPPKKPGRRFATKRVA